MFVDRMGRLAAQLAVPAWQGVAASEVARTGTERVLRRSGKDNGDGTTPQPTEHIATGAGAAGRQKSFRAC